MTRLALVTATNVIKSSAKLTPSSVSSSPPIVLRINTFSRLGLSFSFISKISTEIRKRKPRKSKAGVSPSSVIINPSFMTINNDNYWVDH